MVCSVGADALGPAANLDQPSATISTTRRPIRSTPTATIRIRRRCRRTDIAAGLITKQRPPTHRAVSASWSSSDLS